MKLTLPIIGFFAASMLAGCSISAPSMMAGIGGGATENLAQATVTAESNTPTSTGSIVPSQNEGNVVDLPDASVHTRASGATPQGHVDGLSDSEGDLSAEELHRRELVNRGDLQEGEPLPTQ